MHETGLIEDLIRKVESLVREHSGRRAVAIRLRVGALAAADPDHLREHFETAALGTVAEGARLDIEVSEDLLSSDPGAIILESVEIETG
jgi:hydrogenase nickel incorporation protein HypA/HybF